MTDQMLDAMIDLGAEWARQGLDPSRYRRLRRLARIAARSWHVREHDVLDELAVGVV